MGDKLKLLIINNKIIGCSYVKKVLKHFAEQCNLEHYEIKVAKMDEDDPRYEDEVFNNEILYQEHYGVYASAKQLSDVGDFIQGITDIFVGVDNFADDIIEYIKMTPDEVDDLKLVTNYMYDIVSELIDIDDMSGPSAMYDDFFDIGTILRELIYDNITITTVV